MRWFLTLIIGDLYPRQITCDWVTNDCKDQSELICREGPAVNHIRQILHELT